MNRTVSRILSLILVVAMLLCPAAAMHLDAADALPDPPKFAPETELNNILGKTIAGYQAWFGRNWYHNWSGTSDRNRPFFEIWPSVGDYPKSALWQSNFKKLNNGEDAMLFDSYNAKTIDTQLGWMETYGIDCAAIQRFYAYVENGGRYNSKFNYLYYIRQSAENHGRSFYLMYDMSGTGGHNTNTLLTTLKTDFIYNVEGYGHEDVQNIVSSANYAHADGKPVVCLWGLADSTDATNNYMKADAALQMIQWLQQRGYYVIIGTPENGFSQNTGDYAKVYAAADMISPWYVGRYNMSGIGTTLRGCLVRDKGYCDEHGIDFLPVIFPGFAWTNLQKNEKFNETPRSAGQFMWRQACLDAMYGCETVYFAMFDEYDESTAIMKAATDSTMLPVTDTTYFLTLATDGYWLSDDFYLRLAGEIGKLMKAAKAGEADPQALLTQVPIDFSYGPVYYRNGFTYFNATISEKIVRQRVDPCVGASTKSIFQRGYDLISLTDYQVTESDNEGWYYTFGGESSATAENKGTAHRTINDTKFTLAKDTVLSYRIRANNENGCGVYMNLLFEDGRLLSNKMISAKVTGAKVGEWVEVKVPISNDLAGQRVSAIVASCELSKDGAFAADVDDVLIEIGEKDVGNFEAESEGILGDVDGDTSITTTDARLTLQYAAGKIGGDALDVSMAEVDGEGDVSTTDARLILQKAAGKISKFPVEG